VDRPEATKLGHGPVGQSHLWVLRMSSMDPDQDFHESDSETRRVMVWVPSRSSRTVTRSYPHLVVSTTMWEIESNSVGNGSGQVPGLPGQSSCVGCPLLTHSTHPLTVGGRQNWAVHVDKTQRHAVHRGHLEQVHLPNSTFAWPNSCRRLIETFRIRPMDAPK
jgi:hypothetical protein